MLLDWMAELYFIESISNSRNNRFDSFCLAWLITRVHFADGMSKRIQTWLQNRFEISNIFSRDFRTLWYFMFVTADT